MIRPRIVAIRPEPGLSATIAKGREHGLEIEGQPLFEVRPVAWDPPPARLFDALLAGSANVFRHGGKALGQYRHLPVYAVGNTTAQAAREAGFAIAGIGEGGLQKVARELPGGGSYLRLAGRAHVLLTMFEESTVTTCVIYENTPIPVPENLAESIRGGALVLLHSAEAARHFGAECDRLELPRKAIRLAALGPRIAHAAGSGWRAVRSAEKPNDAALLALAREMCA